MSSDTRSTDSQQLSGIAETLIIETREPVTSPVSTVTSVTSELTGDASHTSSLRSVFQILGPDGRAVVRVEIAA